MTKPRPYIYRYRPNRISYPVAKQYECQFCRRMFHPKRSNNTQYCGKSCAAKARWKDSPKKRLEEPQQSGVFFPVCQTCKSTFAAKTDGRKYCSNACSKQRTLQVLRDQGAAKKGQKQCTCRQCGSSFAPAYGDKRRTFCSDRCAAKTSRRIRKPIERAKMRAAFVEKVDPLKVFDRDKWRCKICLQPTPKALRGTTHSNAPELDHIHPL